MKTVREAALEQEVENLRREIFFLRKGGVCVRERVLDGPIDIVSVTALTETLRASVTVTPRPGGVGRHVVAQTFQDPQNFAYGYYLDKQQTLSPDLALNVLGELHARVINDLAKHYREIVKRFTA